MLCCCPVNRIGTLIGPFSPVRPGGPPSLPSSSVYFLYLVPSLTHIILAFYDFVLVAGCLWHSKSLTFIIASLIESDQQLFCFFCAVIFLFLLDFCKLALLSLQSGWRSDHPHFGNSCHKYCLCTFAKIGWINLGELLSTHETEWSLSIAFSLGHNQLLFELPNCLVHNPECESIATFCDILFLCAGCWIPSLLDYPQSKGSCD